MLFSVLNLAHALMRNGSDEYWAIAPGGGGPDEAAAAAAAAEAEALLREAYRGLAAALGPCHDGTVNAAALLRSLLYSQGRFEEALPLARRVLDGARPAATSAAPRKGEGGEEDNSSPAARPPVDAAEQTVNVTLALNALACCLADVRRRSEAEEMFREALTEIREVVKASRRRTGRRAAEDTVEAAEAAAAVAVNLASLLDEETGDEAVKRPEEVDGLRREAAEFVSLIAAGSGGSAASGGGRGEEAPADDAASSPGGIAPEIPNKRLRLRLRRRRRTPPPAPLPSQAE